MTREEDCRMNHKHVKQLSRIRNYFIYVGDEDQNN